MQKNNSDKNVLSIYYVVGSLRNYIKSKEWVNKFPGLVQGAIRRSPLWKCSEERAVYRTEDRKKGQVLVFMFITNNVDIRSHMLGGISQSSNRAISGNSWPEGIQREFLDTNKLHLLPDIIWRSFNKLSAWESREGRFWSIFLNCGS